MKKFYSVIIILLFISVKSYGQAAIVTDPGSYAYYAEQVASATQTGVMVQQQLSILQQAREGLEKFNKHLQNVSTFIRVVNESARTLKMINEYINSLKSLREVDIRVINMTMLRFIRLSDRILGNIQDIRELLMSYNIKMNDSERITLVDTKLQEMRELCAEANITLRRLNQINRSTTWVRNF